MRLLLAEDEKELSRALVAVLTKNNYTVDAVYNGEDAFDYAKETDYDGIILDVMMPVMDGIEALKKMRKSGISTPVIRPFPMKYLTNTPIISTCFPPERLPSLSRTVI